MSKTQDEADRLKAGTLRSDPLADAERARLRVVSPDERSPDPSDVPAERALLGALLWAGANQPETLRVGAVVDLLEDGKAFCVTSHGDVFDAIVACSKAGAEHDPVAVNAALVKVGRDRGAGGIDGLRALADAASTVNERQARIYATSIRAFWARRSLIRELRVLAEDARQPKTGLPQLVEKAQASIDNLAKVASTGAGSVSIGESAKTLLKRMESKANPAMSTGLRDVDETCNGGLRPVEISVVAADTGVGKSVLGAQIAEHMVTVDPTMGALYISLEMPHESFTMRLVSARARVPLTNLRKNVLNPTQWSAIVEEVSRMQKKGLYFADDRSQTMAGIYAAALSRSRLLAAEGKRLGLVVIDHAGLVKPSADMLKKANREQQVAETSRALGFLAQRLNVHVMALVQINRDSQGKGNEGVPKLRHLAETYALARDPDLVFILHRERDQKSGRLSSDKPAAFVLAKGRMDESAVMLLGYNGAARFYDHNGPETFTELYGR